MSRSQNVPWTSVTVPRTVSFGFGMYPAGERDHLDERGPLGEQAEDARVDLAPGAVGSGPRFQSLGADLFAGKN